MIVTINNIKWKVLFVNRVDINECYGVTSFPSLQIKIAIDYPKEVIRTTITHEVVHAWLESYGYRENDGMLFSEEQVADFIGMNLHNFNELTMKIYLEYKRKYNIK